MKPAAFALLLSLGIAAAGALSAGAVTGAVTGTTATTTTAAVPAPEVTIAAGVTVAGVPVDGLTAAEATVAVADAFAQPLVLIVARHRLEATPSRLGATASVAQAVARAAAAAPRTAVRLRVHVNGTKVRRYVRTLARRFERRPIDSRLYLRGLRPYLTPDRPGRVLQRPRLVQAIVTALVKNSRRPIRVAVKAIAPIVTRTNFGPVIVIRRGSNQLYLYRGMRFARRFGVATGQSVYPTPLGRFTIVVKWRNPWWYPPASPWAQGQEPVPPGPGNPLGTRWMGLSAGGVGIHGTPNSGSIGYSVSHGCIRMRIPEAEWLFERVNIGTPVFIVAA